MDLKELILAYTTKVYNKTEEEAISIIFDEKGEIKDNAFETMAGLDTVRVKRLKDESKTKFDNGYSKAKEEILSEIEKDLKTEFGITDELPFKDLLPKIKEITATKSKLTSDDVKKHPEYLALEKERVKKDDYDKLSADFENFKKGIDRKIKLDKVKEKALLNLEGFKPDYPDVPQIKQNLINVFLQKFEEFEDFEITDGQILPIKEGKRVEDAHGNPIPFDKLCKETASGFFKFKVQDSKGNAGNREGGQASFSGDFTFNTKEEMTEAYSKLTDDKEKKDFLLKAKLA